MLQERKACVPNVCPKAKQIIDSFAGVLDQGACVVATDFGFHTTFLSNTRVDDYLEQEPGVGEDGLLPKAPKPLY